MLSTPPAFILSQDQTLMLKVYPVQKFLATVFKVAFYKSCSFIFMMTWIFSFAILPALKRAYSLLNLSRLFTVQLSKFCLLLEASRCRCSSQRQLIYYITVELVCQQLFILFFQAVWLVRSAVLGDSLFILSQAISFVNNFFILFSKVCFPHVVSRNGLSYYHHCFLLSTIFFMFFTRNT